MKRLLPIIVLGLTPILGVAIATVAAWQKYPSRQVSSSEMFDDVSARSNYMMWGGIIGGVAGVLGAGLMTLNGGSKPARNGPKKKRLKCNACGALHPIDVDPSECSWCQAPWSATEVQA